MLWPGSAAAVSVAGAELRDCGDLPYLGTPRGWGITSAICCSIFAGNRDWGFQRAGQLWAEGPSSESRSGPQIQCPGAG